MLAWLNRAGLDHVSIALGWMLATWPVVEPWWAASIVIAVYWTAGAKDYMAATPGPEREEILRALAFWGQGKKAFWDFTKPAVTAIVMAGVFTWAM